MRLLQLALTLSGIVVHHADIIPNKLLAHDGLLIENRGHVYKLAAIYDVLIHIESPPEPDGFELLLDQVNKSIVGMTGSDSTEIRQQLFQIQLKRIYTTFEYGKQEIQFGHETYTDDEASSFRDKRGLVDIVGIGLSKLFGLSTEHQTDLINRELKILKEQHAVHRHVTDRFLTVVNSAVENLAENRADINHLKMGLNNITKQMKIFHDEQEQAYTEMKVAVLLQIYLNKLEVAADNFALQATTYRSRRRSLESGIINDELLTKGMLTTIGAKVAKLGLMAPPLLWSYQHLKIGHLITTPDGITFRVAIPLHEREQYDLWKFWAFPTFWGANNNVTKKIMVPDKIAIDHGGERHFEPDMRTSCIGSSPYFICLPPAETVGPSCEKEMLLRNNDSLHLCQFEFVKSPTKISISRVGINRVVIIPQKKTTGIHTCQRDLIPRTITINEPTLFDLGIYCDLAIEGVKISSILTEKHNFTIKPSYVHANEPLPLFYTAASTQRRVYQGFRMDYRSSIRVADFSKELAELKHNLPLASSITRTMPVIDMIQFALLGIFCAVLLVFFALIGIVVYKGKVRAFWTLWQRGLPTPPLDNDQPSEPPVTTTFDGPSHRPLTASAPPSQATCVGPDEDPQTELSGLIKDARDLKETMPSLRAALQEMQSGPKGTSITDCPVGEYPHSENPVTGIRYPVWILPRETTTSPLSQDDSPAARAVPRPVTTLSNTNVPETTRIHLEIKNPTISSVQADIHAPDCS